MIPIEEALKIVEENIPIRRVVRLRLEDAFGRCLAEDLTAPEASPRYTNSAMDGYALSWADCAGASPNTPIFLEIVGESQAGIPFAGELAAGCAVRISTGAMLPVGSDTVLRLEDSREEEGRLEVLQKPVLGQDVRQVGEEFQPGDRLLAKGALLKARELAILAAVGISEVMVLASPRVAILVTGTELANHDNAAILPYQIRDSNALMLMAAVRECAGETVLAQRLEDSLIAATAAIAGAQAAGADIILCSGGVSVGRHDHVKEATLAAGFKQLFWKVKQKPGKPLFFCRRDDTLFFGLPGNPVSTYMCFYKYVAPVLANLTGRRPDGRSAGGRLIGAAAAPLVNDDNRTHLTRVRLAWRDHELPLVSKLRHQGSHMLTGLVMADGFITLEPGQTVAAGELIEVSLF